MTVLSLSSSVVISMEGMVPDIDRGFGREPLADMMGEGKDRIHPNPASV